MYFSAAERFFDTINDTKRMSVSIKVKLKLRKDMNADGTMPLVIHVTGSSQRERINPSINVIPKYFDEKNQQVKPINREYQDINLLIGNYISKINAIKTEFRLSDREITPKLLKQELIGGLTRTNFVAFIADALEDEKVNNSPGTYKRYESIYNKLKEFSENIPFSEIDHK